MPFARAWALSVVRLVIAMLALSAAKFIASVFLASVVPERAETTTSPATPDVIVNWALPFSSVVLCSALNVAEPCSTIQSTFAPVSGWFCALTTFATSVTLSVLFAVACILSAPRLMTCAVAVSAPKLSTSLFSDSPCSRCAETVVFSTLMLLTLRVASPLSSLTL